MLLLNINWKPYMGSPMAPSHLERSKSRSPRFRSLLSRKGAELGHKLLTINRKPYMGSSMTPSHLTSCVLALKGQSQGHSDLSGRRLVWYTYICHYFIITSIWMSQIKKSLIAGGVFRCPSGLSCYIFDLRRP